MRVDRQVALEAQEEMLAVHVDGAHSAARQALRPAIAAEAGVRRRQLRDLAFDDRPDAARGVVDRVALGHAL